MVCIEKRPYTLYGRLATLHFRYLTCLLDRGHITQHISCLFYIYKYPIIAINIAKKAKNIKLIVNAYPNVRIVLNTFIFFIPGSFLLILR